MKRIVLLMVLTALFITLVATDITTSGDFRTRFTWYKDFGNSLAQNYFDSRAQLKFDVSLEKDLSFVYLLRSGDMLWGGSSAGEFSKAINVKTRHAYLDWKCPFTGMNVKLGLQPWYDHRSLVLDDDMAGLILSSEMNENTTVQYGYVQWEEANEESELNGYDKQMYMVNFDSKLNEELGLGLNTLFNRFRNDAEYSAYDMWLMPFVTYTTGPLSLDGMFALSMGNSPKALGTDDLKNSGMAISVKADYDMQSQGTYGFDFLYTSGDDGSDPKSTTEFKTISSYYMNGLEYLGIGVHDSFWLNGNPMPTYYFDGNGQLNNHPFGIMSMVIKGNYPLKEKTNIHFAAGMVNFSTKIKNSNMKTDIGTEFDLGVKHQLYEKLSVDLVGAYVLPGEAYGPDLDNVYEVSSVFTLEF